MCSKLLFIKFNPSFFLKTRNICVSIMSIKHKIKTIKMKASKIPDFKITVPSVMSHANKNMAN